MNDTEFKDIDWSEKVDDPRELEWKYCFSPEERIAISEEILETQKNGKLVTTSK